MEELSQYFEKEFTEKGKTFISSYRSLLESDDTTTKDNIKTSMYDNLIKLQFSQMIESDGIRQLNLLREAFKEYVDNQKDDLTEKTITKLKNKISDTNMYTYNNYLKKYFDLKSVKQEQHKNYKKFVPNNQEEFDEMYNQGGNPIALLVNGFNREEDPDTSIGKDIFKEYMNMIFEFYLVKFMYDEKYIDQEIDYLKKQQDIENRKKSNIKIDFDMVEDPLLRQFFIFIYMCVSFLSNEVTYENSQDSLSFWSDFETSSGGKIINTDEGDKFIEFLDGENRKRKSNTTKFMNPTTNSSNTPAPLPLTQDSTEKIKAKLAYCLINMKYF